MGSIGRPIMSLTDLDEASIIEIAENCTIQPMDIEDIYAPTPLQIASMAASAKSVESSTSAAHQYTVSLGPSLDLETFCAALQQVVESNAILRTRIVECSHGLLQVVVQQKHLTERYAPTRDLDTVLLEERSHPMSLGCQLFRSALAGRTLILTLHHSIFDQWTSMAMMADVAEVLQGCVPSPRPPFKDFVAHCYGMDENDAKSFWVGQYQNPVVVWPYVDPSYAPSATCVVEKEMLFNKAVQRPISPPLLPSYIEAAWVLTSKSYSQAESVLYGFVFSGRGHASEHLHTTLGPTVANIPIQATVPETVRELLKQRTQARRKLQAHPALQYGLNRIGLCSEAARAASRFQTLLNIRATEVDVADSEMGKFSSLESVPAPYTLVLECGIVQDGVSVRARSDPSIIPKRQLDRIVHQFEHFMQQLVDLRDLDTRIDTMGVLSNQDFAEIQQWNRALQEIESCEECIYDKFARHVQAQPNALAVDACDGKASYIELDGMATNFASELRSRGVQQETPVLLVFGKSIWAIVAMLAVLKAGGACVPVDPAHPIKRKQMLLCLTKAKLILSSEGLQSALAADLNAEVLAISADYMSKLPAMTGSAQPPPCSPDQAAFIMFTSGSTGVPKGVILEHRGLAASLTAFGHFFGLEPGYRMLQFASLVWDASLTETIGALIHGCCVCIPSEDARDSNLTGYINSARIDAAVLTPTVIKTISGDQIPNLKILCSGGEPVDPHAAEHWGGQLRFVNGWGLTETSVCSLATVLEPKSQYPTSIGYPLGCAVWLVDPCDRNKPVPIGAIGEIVVEGPGVARCYLGEETTPEASSFFVERPKWLPLREKGFRFYSTGDLARYNQDGSIGFVGRSDNRVKVRGQRFELGEVERSLSSVAPVHYAVCTLVGPDLVAVLSIDHADKESLLQPLRPVPDNDQIRVLAAIRNTAEQQLPIYMIPIAWFVVQDLPRSMSGKLDRARIIEWVRNQDIAAAKQRQASNIDVMTAPTGDLEQMIQSIWALVLDLPETSVSRESSFISLGGDSILAMRVAGRCRQKGVHVTVAGLLRGTSLEDVAKCCKQDSPKIHTDARNGLSIPEEPDDQADAQVGLSALGLTAEAVESILPCTPIQNGIVLHQMRDRNAGASINRIILQLHSKQALDLNRLARSWEAICSAHGILRTIFTSDHSGEMKQIVLKKGKPWTTILSNTPSASSDEAPEFAPAQPQHRLLLAREPDGNVLIRLDISHALIDPFTISQICAQLVIGYEDPNAIRPGKSFGPYATESMMRCRKDMEYWTSLLSGSSPCLLPFGKLFGSNGTSRNSRYQCRVPLGRGEQIRLLSRQLGVTVASIVQVAWAVVLRLYTLAPRPIFGCIVNTRDELGSEAESVLGPLLAMIVSRMDLTRIVSVADLLVAAKDGMAVGLEHTALSLGELNDALGLGESPLFDTALSFVRDLPNDLDEKDGISVKPIALDDKSEYTIMVKVVFSDDFEAWLDCRSADIPQSHASIIASAFGKVIDRILQDPSLPASELMDIPLETFALPEPFSHVPTDVIAAVKRDASTQIRLPKSCIEDIYPCTPVQEHLAETSHCRRGGLYWTQQVFRAEDRTEADRLSSALDILASAHPALRTRFVSLGKMGVFQAVVRSRLTWAEDDNLEDYLAWDLEVGATYGEPLCRLGRVRETESDAMHLVLSIHRAICDDLSLRMLMRDLEEAYRSQELNLRSSSSAVIGAVSGLCGQQADRFWQQQLTLLDEAARFPVEANKALQTGSDCVAKLEVATPQCSTEAVLKPIFYAAWALTLSRITGSNLVKFWASLDPKQALPAGIKFGLGAGTAPVPFVVDVDRGMSSKELIDRMNLTVLETLPHVHALKPDFQSLATPNILTVMVEDTPESSRFVPSFVDTLRVQNPPRPCSEQPVMVRCNVGPEKTLIEMAFNSNAVSLERANLVLHQFGHALSQVSSQLDTPLQEFPDVSPHELGLLENWNKPLPKAHSGLIHEHIAAVARRQPEAMAVSSWDDNLTYDQLNKFSNHGADRMRALGVRPGTIIPILFEKSAVLIAVLLAVLKAGCAIMPLDPTHPRDRLASSIKSGGCSFAICSARFKKQAGTLVSDVICVELADWSHDGALASSAAERSRLDPGSACYLIFTSGSTGTPKGITISHANAVAAAMSFVPELGLGPATKTIQATNYIFDVAMGDIFFTLLAGGCLCMPPSSQLREDIAGAINHFEANFAFITPTMASLVKPAQVPGLRTLALIGEPVTREAAEIWSDHLRLLNTYGPAEATILTSSNDVSTMGVDTFRNVGRPVSCRYWVVSPEDHNTLCAIGCPGELLIEGPTVAQGYLNDEKRTSAAFIKPPTWSRQLPRLKFSDRLYRTGDIATQEPDGSVVIQGRRDSQVKIRGNRVELGEIEYHIRRLAGPKWGAAVEFVADQGLIAFLGRLDQIDRSTGGNIHNPHVRALVLDPNPGSAAIIHQGLLEALPSYMVPGVFVLLEKIPSNSVGKTDRKRLRDLVANLSPMELKAYHVHNHEEVARERPSQFSRVEIVLRRLWSEVLDCPAAAISGTDDFFVLRGNSLRAMRLVGAARKAGLALALEHVFEFPVLCDMAAAASKSVGTSIDIAGAASSIDTSLSLSSPVSRSLPPHHVECITPATGMQALMLTTDRKWARDSFTLAFSPPVSVQALEAAISSVTQHHTVLRTILVREESEVLQATLKYIVPDSVSSELDDVMLTRFHMIHDGKTCSSLQLRIHHAFYDNISLKLILADLASAYQQQPLSDGPRFDDWAAYVSREDIQQEARQFWRGILAEREAPTYVAAECRSPSAHRTLQRKLQIRVPLAGIRQYAGTPASVVKAAWARVLSHVTNGTDDVVFAEATANRNLSITGIEQVRGPCVNLIPVRVRVARSSTLSSLVSAVQAQAQAALPYHHVDMRKILGGESEWWRGSVIVFQDYAHADVRFQMGSSDVCLEGESQVGDLADVWIVARPESELLVVEMDCSDSITNETVQVLARSMETVLKQGSLGDA